MAPTFRMGRDAELLISSTAGTLVTLSSGLNEIRLRRSLELDDITTLEDQDTVHLPSLREGTLNFAGLFSSTHAEILDGLQAWDSTSKPTFQFYPDTTAIGKRYWTGQGVLSDLEYTMSAEELVELSGELTVSGLISLGTVIAPATGGGSVYNVPFYNEVVFSGAT